MNQLTKMIALLCGLALLAAACSSDDSSSADQPADDSSTEDSSADDSPADDSSSDAGDESDEGTEAAGEPIKIGVLTSLTGPFTSWGLHVEAGMELAAADINAAGGVDGRMIELVIADDQSDGEEGVIQFERMLDDGVVAIAGTISSGVGGATAVVAEETEVPLFFSKAGSDALLTTDSRYTFRTCLPAGPMLVTPWVQYATDAGYTRVGQMIADYGWGQSFLAASEPAFAAAGIDLQSEVAPVGEQDYTTYLRSLGDFEPELLLATGHPPGSGTILAQSVDLGFDDVNVVGPGSSLTSVLEAAGDSAIGRYADLSCADYFGDEYAELAQRYVTANPDLGFMEDDAVAMYALAWAIAEAVGEVGDEPTAVADYMRQGSFEGPGMVYPLAWTEWGELADSRLLLVEVGAGPAPAGLNTAGEWWPEQLFLSEPLVPYQPGS